jgi:hypothetical protein
MAGAEVDPRRILEIVAGIVRQHRDEAAVRRRLRMYVQPRRQAARL